MMHLTLPGPFWLIGCGNMAGAMLDRWLQAGMDRSQITVIRPSGKPVTDGVRVLTAYPEGQMPALAMLGTKPQKIDEVTPLLAPRLGTDTILLSILAGIEMQSLRARFPAARTIVKALPNTPVKLGKGVVNLFSEKGPHPLVEQLMAPLGATEWFSDEQLFQAAGILTGAGPAFLFRFIDALAAGGEAIGLPPAQAACLAKAMVEGAAALAASEAETPAGLAERVASPAGTTRAGLDVLDEEAALASLLRQTLEAGLRRSREMAQEARREPS